MFQKHLELCLDQLKLYFLFRRLILVDISPVHGQVRPCPYHATTRLVPCLSPGCVYTTPVELPDFTILTEHLTLYCKLAHPVQHQAGPAVAGLTAKLDKRLRPQATLGMSELNWRFYVSEWSRYTGQTGIADRVLLDELWNTMDTELRQLAFSD